MSPVLRQSRALQATHDESLFLTFFRMLQMCTLNVVRNVSPENVFKRVQRVGFVNLYLPLRKKTF